MGGLECKFIFTYKNSCAVVAQVADDPSPSMISTYQSAPTLEVASKLAIDGCSSKNEPLLNSEWMPGRIRLSLSEP